jgi:uncharacterized protein YdhG (YjbR/CyaY superfamily)
VTVDEFVEKRVRPEHREIVAEVRALMRKHAPAAEELISYGIPMYRLNKPIAWITPSRSGITVGFREGARFEDRHGLLKARSRHSKNVSMKTVKDVNRAALRDYIRQAVAIDTGEKA